MAEKRKSAVTPIEQMLRAQAAALAVIDDHRPAVPVIPDPINEHHGHAAIPQQLEARAVLVDGGDDDSLNPGLHQQVEVLHLAPWVVPAVADDNTHPQLLAARPRAQSDVDEERVVEVRDRESECAHPAGPKLTGALVGHEVELAYRGEHPVPGLLAHIGRTVEYVACLLYTSRCV